ncbi:hypothetical protein B0H12DRAFT_1329664 [Mycena haematopus]|nr:hypothetical protein B0H12DRAFT_1329664 [Mycena haematopus]
MGPDHLLQYTILGCSSAPPFLDLQSQPTGLPRIPIIIASLTLQSNTNECSHLRSAYANPPASFAGHISHPAPHTQRLHRRTAPCSPVYSELSVWLCALLFPTPAPESQRGGRRRPLASSRPRHFLYPTSHPHVSPSPNTPHITLIPSASHQPLPRPNDAKKRTLDLDVLLQVNVR